MATVRVVVPKSNSTRRFNIRNSKGNSRTLAFTPTGFDFTENAKVGTVDRPGRKPLVRVTGPGSKTLRMTQTVAHPDWKKSIAADLNWLRTCAAKGYRVKFSGVSSLEAGVWWQIKSLQIAVEQRATNNEPSRARVSWDLIEAQDVSVTAAKAAPKPAPKKKITKKVNKPVLRTHKVRKGDTLWAISRRYLGKPTRWPEIFKLNQGSGKNQIKNPNLIYPNQVFKIPAK